MFLHYFPILLRDKLKAKYYNHFLLIVYATKCWSKPIISREDIDHAEYLINLFLKDRETLYGENKITYNLNVASHLCEYVRLYGSSSEWDTYDFEDFNGFAKSIVHGTNNNDIEIVNTLKICNAFSVLKHILQSKSVTDKKDRIICMKYTKDLNEVEKNKIAEFCRKENVQLEDVKIFSRININKEVYSSIKYTNQKKRDNSQICWKGCEGDEKYGIIQLFF